MESSSTTGIDSRSPPALPHGCNTVPMGVCRLASIRKRGRAYVAGFLAFVKHVSWIRMTFAIASQPTVDTLHLHRHMWPKLSQVQFWRLKTKERTPNIFLENLLTMNKLSEVLILLTTNKFSINFNKKPPLYFLQYLPQVY